MQEFSKTNKTIFNEIKSQGNVISQALEHYKTIDSKVIKKLNNSNDIVFIGCGSSFHSSIYGKFLFNSITEYSSSCITSSEFLLYPENYIKKKDTAFILISRTGGSTETINSLKILQDYNRNELSIVTIPDSDLAKISSFPIVMDYAKEISITATRSVSSTMAIIASMFFSICNRSKSIENISRKNEELYKDLDKYCSIIETIVNKSEYRNFVFLGSGPLYSTALESELKVKEMSITFAESNYPLEYRHGHKAIIDNDTLIIIFLSENGFDYELKAALEFKKIGGNVLLIGDTIEDRVLKEFNYVIDTRISLNDLIKPIFYVLFGQLLGYYMALKKRIDPTNPRNLDYCVKI